jgi:serine protease Do
MGCIMVGSRLWIAGLIVAGVFVSEPDRARAQDRMPATRDDAVLSVDGIVREVFQSARQNRVDFVVQIEVKRSESLRAPRNPVRVVMPAPGDMVYVHTSKRQDAALGLADPGSGQPPLLSGIARTVPVERAQVRAYLYPRPNGIWEGAGSDWFELTTKALAGAAAKDPPAAAADPAPGPVGPRPLPTPGAAKDTRTALTVLGLTGEAKTVQGKFVVRVSSVEPGGPSQRAGLEPGDIIIGANDQALSGIEQLEALAQRGDRLNLVVLDVNTGKTARVPVELGVMGRPGTPGGLPPLTERPQAPVATRDATNPNSRVAGRSLGVSAEPVAIGQRTGMKVIGVHPDSPAQKAGIEVGDVIVAANGVPITGAESLSAVVRKSGASLSLSVRDTRTGKDTPVEVKLGGEESGTVGGAPVEAPRTAGAGQRLGAVTELVFYDVDPAAKVTEVEPGGPAARAGIEPGDVIVEANGAPVLHPKNLEEAVRKSGPTLKLMVVDPRTQKKTAVDVNL